ncbi:MAG: hypothetical protein P1U86_22695 [Verrucomicrobiales bacterium]|nr:hypothetical protein [Verrucomicrobiales bacterium]
MLWQAEPFDSYASLLEEGKLEGEIENEGSPSKRIVFADGAKLAGVIERINGYFALEEPALMSRIEPAGDN